MTTPTFENFTGDLAANYERHFVPTVPAPLADETLARAGLRAGERVVDVACGTGIVARVAAERLGPDAEVIGVDLSPGMLDHARSITAAAGVRIDWREGDAAKLPVDDGWADVALCQLGLMFVDDKPGAALELHRVLKPGGRVVVNVPGAIQPINEAFADALARHIDPGLGGFLRAVFAMPDPDQLGGPLTAAGFTDVETSVVDTPFQLPAPAEYLWGYVSATPLGMFMADTPADARRALEADLTERWQPYLEGGRLSYVQPIVWATAHA